MIVDSRPEKGPEIYDPNKNRRANIGSLSSKIGKLEAKTSPKSDSNSTIAAVDTIKIEEPILIAGDETKNGKPEIIIDMQDFGGVNDFG